MRPAATPIELPYKYESTSNHIVVDQNSERWFQEREKCDLTASEIPSAIGVGYDSPATLYKKKKGIAIPSKEQPNYHMQEAMKRGQYLEPHARAMMDIIFDRSATDGGFWTRGLEYEGRRMLLGASPDGIYYKTPTRDAMVLEIKCPTTKTDGAPDSEDYRDRFWTYFFQIQCQLFCTQIDKAVLFIYHPELPSRSYFIKFDRLMWGQYVLPRLANFLAAVREGIEPGRTPAATKRELKIVWAERLVDRGVIVHYELPQIPRAPPKRKEHFDDGGLDDEEMLEAAIAFEQQGAFQEKKRSLLSPPADYEESDRGTESSDRH